MDGAAGAGAGGPTLRSFQATIRYVLNGGTGVTLEDFVWSVVPDGKSKTVYRGQAGASTKAIAGDRSTPLEIKTDRARPLSTSALLTSKSEDFARVPDGSGAVGRVFAIELQPGVRYASLHDQTPDEFKSYAFKGKDKAAATRRTKAAFEFLDAELPAGHRLKGQGVDAQSGLFFNFMGTERELLLDPRTIQFVSDPTTKAPESWDRPGVPARSFDLTPTGKRIETEESAADTGRPPWDREYQSHPITVYKTYAIPKPTGGRRRTRNHRRRTTRKHRRHQ